MRVFVSGASGFIGARLVEKLLESDKDVHILCRPTSDLSSLDMTRVRRFNGDIMDAKSVHAAMEGCDRAFHIAGYAKNWAKDVATFYRINVDGTKNVLDAARAQGVKRTVVTSTSVTFGPSNGIPTTEATKRTVPALTTYEDSKIRMEESIEQYVQQGQDVVIVGPTRVFGPGALTEANSLTIMVQLYLKGRFRVILGDGNGIGNYAFVDDVVDGHIKAMELGKTGARYVLGGEDLSYNAFFEVVSNIANKRYRMIRMPAKAAYTYAYLEKWRAEYLFGYPKITPEWVSTFLADWAFSSEKARREIGYQITPARDALATTINWLSKP